MSMLNLLRGSRRLSSTRTATCVVVACAVSGVAASPAAASSFQGLLESGHHTFHPVGPAGSGRPFSGAQHAVCAAPSAGSGQCLVHVLQPSGAAPAATVASPTGLSPSAFEGIYGLGVPASAGTGETIALVDAYSDPNAASDLSKFSAQYGLPAANFSQVSQTGSTRLPATNASWDLEISLDIEWAHALAPGARILLVEATNSSLANLLAAESYAGAHANYVSNSWGSSEFSGEQSYDSYFAQPGVSYFAAAGDTGGQVIWPSASPSVISIGGTSLQLTTGGTLAQESAWSGGGGGCSRYESANAAQSTGSVRCAGKRATPDISIDADPNSGVSVYDSVTYDNQSGWWTVGGTSASTAIVAGVAAATGVQVTPPVIYGMPYVRDILLGSNGYAAMTGYDLATGRGSLSLTPGAPTGLTATASGGHVTLNWGAPTGPSVTQYDIWRGTTSGQETTEVGTVSASGQLTFTDTPPGSGQYYYVVQAVNGSGLGPFSNEASG